MEKILVQVEITWGREFNGEYNALTPGKGCCVTIMTHWSDRKAGAGFRGCPLGTGTTVDCAIQDFVNRARAEYCGKEKLSVAMIQVVETRDMRK